MRILIFIFLLLFIGGETKVEWISSLEYDFEEMKPHELKSTVFEFININEEVLFIDNVRASCGCTNIEYEDFIEPGMTSKVSISVSKNKKGPFREKIKVYFNDIRKPSIIFISGEIK